MTQNQKPFLSLAEFSLPLGRIELGFSPPMCLCFYRSSLFPEKQSIHPDQMSVTTNSFAHEWKKYTQTGIQQALLEAALKAGLLEDQTLKTPNVK